MKRTLPFLIALAVTVVVTSNALAARYASRTLREGSTGGDVRKLQRFLDHTGRDTAADGQFGPATAESLMDFEQAEDRRVDGVATRPEQRLVRARAVGEPEVAAPAGDKATIGPDGLAVPPASAPPEVAEIIAAGNEIATKPYKYGGGHGSWRDSGYDCSGSVSYALHGAGLLDTQLDSSALEAFGKRGRGARVSVMANAGHAYMVVAGLRFDTSSSKGNGNRWTTRMRSRSGYTVRHPVGL
jgi:cell wall-associated NlpC family hydrolase